VRLSTDRKVCEAAVAACWSYWNERLDPKLITVTKYNTNHFR